MRCSASRRSTADPTAPLPAGGPKAGTELPAFDAVVVAGGAARRLHGVDKMLVMVAGHRLLDRALHAAAGARLVVAVGPQRAGATAARWVREEPPGGGPVAAVAAGLAEVTAEVVVLLAADLPFVGPGHVDLLRRELVQAGEDVAGVLFVDPSGRDQPLLSAWRAAALRTALPANPAGLGLLRTLAPLSVRRIAGGDDLIDCDTPDDVERARTIAERQEGRRPE